MDAQERATLIRDVVIDSVDRSCELTGDRESFVIAVCVGRNDGEEYTNVTCTSRSVTITEAVLLMLKSLEKMLFVALMNFLDQKIHSLQKVKPLILYVLVLELI